MLFYDYCTLLSYLNKPNSKFKFVVAAWCIITAARYRSTQYRVAQNNVYDSINFLFAYFSQIWFYYLL